MVGSNSKFKRGARKSPRHKLLAATPHRTRAVPPQFAYVPGKLDVWGNDVDGDCVTAEEAFAKACYSPEIFIDPSVVISWARANGFLDGADLTEVMDVMKSAGFVVGPQTYNDGGYTAVDYSDEANLQSAISSGPVKIAIDADALPSEAGNNQGWVATGGSPGQFANTDHCVSICGYGPASWLCAQLGVPLPSTLQPDQPMYLLYTWATIGLVDHAWIMSTCTESWLRNPTTVGVPALPSPTPTPTPPNPDPVPPIPPGPVPPNPVPPPFVVNIPQQPVAGNWWSGYYVPAFQVYGGKWDKQPAAALPTWVTELLAFACQGSASLPSPWGPLLQILCTFVVPPPPAPTPAPTAFHEFLRALASSAPRPSSPADPLAAFVRQLALAATVKKPCGCP